MWVHINKLWLFIVTNDVGNVFIWNENKTLQPGEPDRSSVSADYFTSASLEHRWTKTIQQLTETWWFPEDPISSCDKGSLITSSYAVGGSRRKGLSKPLWFNSFVICCGLGMSFSTNKILKVLQHGYQTNRGKGLAELTLVYKWCHFFNLWHHILSSCFCFISAWNIIDFVGFQYGECSFLWFYGSSCFWCLVENLHFWRLRRLEFFASAMLYIPHVSQRFSWCRCMQSFRG